MRGPTMYQCWARFTPVYMMATLSIRCTHLDDRASDTARWQTGAFLPAIKREKWDAAIMTAPMITLLRISQRI